MTSKSDPTAALPPIPAKRYFTIGEVSELCGVKPHVLRYWEQEFTQLRPMKRRGNRRYYQHHEVLLVRRIRELLYQEGFTISGARNRLGEAQAAARGRRASDATGVAEDEAGLHEGGSPDRGDRPEPGEGGLHRHAAEGESGTPIDLEALRADLERALQLLR
jgi:DNA-binding transcriptional MerR regulator